MKPTYASVVYILKCDSKIIYNKLVLLWLDL